MTMLTPSNPPIALRVTVAQSLLSRMRGLLWRPSPQPAEGMLISRCRAIHTLGMGYPIDVVFVDRCWLIVGVVAGVAPGRWKLSAPKGSRCAHVLEMAIGEADRLKLQPGVRLKENAL